MHGSEPTYRRFAREDGVVIDTSERASLSDSGLAAVTASYAQLQSVG